MIKSNNLWSPHPPSAYTVVLGGELAGLGAREEFTGRPGLWNLFWLHSVRVDALLDWPDSPELAPMDTMSMSMCLESCIYNCDGVTLEVLAEFLSSSEFVDRMVARNYQPPIRRYWEQTSDGWLGFVRYRLRTFKSLSKLCGTVVKGNFPLHNNS